MPGIAEWLRRRPCLRDALWWSMPALAAGLVARVIFMGYSPFALWTQDSFSFMNFSQRLFLDLAWDLEDKRRWTYPLTLAFAWILPGGCLRWVAAGQHALGLISVLAVGWIARRCFGAWRLWIIPLTMAVSLMPDFLCYEHSVLAESIFINLGVLAMAGWVKWCVPSHDPRHFWFFFVPFALQMLCKPSGRFFLPGFLIAFLLTGLWKKLQRSEWVALVALCLATTTVGSEGQGVRMLYTTVFPATRLDGPCHAEYKAEIRDLVEAARRNLGLYYETDSDLGIKGGLDEPAKLAGRPLWQALGQKGDEVKAKKNTLYRDLALEALLHEPWVPIYVAAQRIVASSPKVYYPKRLAPGHEARRMTEDHMYPRLSAREPKLLRAMYGFSQKGPLPPVEAFCSRVSPRPSAWGGRGLEVLTWQARLLAMSRPPATASTPQPIHLHSPTAFGWLLVAGLLLSLLPTHRIFFATWALATFSYLFGVFMTGSTNPRYFAPAVPLLLILAVLPLDTTWRWAASRISSALKERKARHRNAPG